MAIIPAFVQPPDVIEKGGIKSAADDGSAWSFSHLRLGALAIFFYVGAEVAIGSVMINFLGQPSMGGFSPEYPPQYLPHYCACTLLHRFLLFFSPPCSR